MLYDQLLTCVYGHIVRLVFAEPPVPVTLNVNVVVVARAGRETITAAATHAKRRRVALVASLRIISCLRGI